MQFHFGSFLIGWGAGIATSEFARRNRSLLAEAATALFKVADAAAAQAATYKEDLEDAVAEGRARARPKARHAPNVEQMPRRRPRRTRARSGAGGRTPAVA